MSLEIWLLFVATELVLCLIPGPAVLTVVSQAIRLGTHTGMSTAAGVLVANALYFAISATGLLAVLIAWYEFFFLIKWLGAAYLVWIGVQTWRTSREPTGEEHQPERRDLAEFSARGNWSAARRGFAVQAANPKTLLFFGALLPQFVDPKQPAELQIAILGATSIALEFGVLASYAALADRGSAWARRPVFAKWLQRAGGSLLIAAGAGLASLRRAS